MSLLVPISLDMATFPSEIQEFISGSRLFDSSCSANARVTFIDKDQGFFLKTSAKGSLLPEAEMTRFFHSKGLAAEVVTYISGESDWLLTRCIYGEDCTSPAILAQPERLCDLLAEYLLLLHSTNYNGCPIMDHTKHSLARAEDNYRTGKYDQAFFPDKWGYASAEEAWKVIETEGHLLKTDSLLHGDYCLPNIILNNWSLSGFVDLGNGGVGDIHEDVFDVLKSLERNLKTNRYRERFIYAYGKSKVNEDTLRLIAALGLFW